MGLRQLLERVNAVDDRCVLSGTHEVGKEVQILRSFGRRPGNDAPAVSTMTSYDESAAFGQAFALRVGAHADAVDAGDTVVAWTRISTSLFSGIGAPTSCRRSTLVAVAVADVNLHAWPVWIGATWDQPSFDPTAAVA